MDLLAKAGLQGGITVHPTIITWDPGASNTGDPVQRTEMYRNQVLDLNLVRVNPGFRKPAHPFTEGDSLMLILSGELKLQVDGEEYVLRPMQLAVIPRGAARGFEAGPQGAMFAASHLHLGDGAVPRS